MKALGPKDRKARYIKSVETNVDKMDARLKHWAARIDRLATQAGRAGIEYRLSIDDLKIKRAVAQVRVDEFKAAGVEKWEELRAGIELAWSELEVAFSDLKH